MPVTREQVLRIAALARLRLTRPEADRLAAQLGQILDHVADLESAELPTAPGIADAPSPVGPPATPLQADEGRPDELRVAPSEMAPAWIEGFFTVPRLAAMQPDAGTGS